MQCFKVYRDEIEKRIDANYYQPAYLAFDENLNKVKTKIKKIEEFSKVICGPFGSSIKNGDYREAGVPLIRINNINEDKKLIFEDLTYIEENLANQLNSYRVKENDIVISQRGTLGLTAIVPKEFNKAVISANFIAIKNIDGEVIPDFLQIYLNTSIGNTQLARKTSGQVQTKITTEDIKTIKVIIPCKETQNRIVELMQTAYENKKQKEQEADRLLNSMDDFVLEQLGIELPEVQDKMCFAVRVNEIEKRIDADFYQPKFIENINKIKSTKYNIVTLEQISEKIINGFDYRDFKEEGAIPYLRVGNIKPNSFDLTDVKFIDDIELLKDVKLQVGDLLITRKGSYGIAVIVNKQHKNCVICSEIFRIVLKNKEINPEYISYWLNTSTAQINFKRISTGAIMGHISQEALKEVKIPLPPINIQDNIAKESKARINTAKQLQKEAQEELQQAKARVERIILGGRINPINPLALTPEL